MQTACGIREKVGYGSHSLAPVHCDSCAITDSSPTVLFRRYTSSLQSFLHFGSSAIPHSLNATLHDSSLIDRSVASDSIADRSRSVEAVASSVVVTQFARECVILLPSGHSEISNPPHRAHRSPRASTPP
eukprot:3292151-Prymnesium_polylepis.1